MSIWLVFLIAVVVGALLSVTLSRPSRRREVVDGSGDSITLVHPKSRLRLGIFVAVAPAIGFARVAEDPSDPGAFLLVAVCSFGCGLGGLVVLLTCRKIVITRRSVELRGFRGFALSWDDVDGIEARNAGILAGFHFVARDGRRVIADPSMVGWIEFTEQLAPFVPDRLKPATVRALAQLRDDTAPST